MSYPPLIPAFAVHDGAAAVTFYQEAFGATELYRLVDPQSGKIGHADQFYGHRSSRVIDPFGHEWMLQREFEKVTPEEMQRRWNAACAS